MDRLRQTLIVGSECDITLFLLAAYISAHTETIYELPSLQIICKRARPHDYLGHIISLYSSMNRRHSHSIFVSSYLQIFAYSEIRNYSDGVYHDFILPMWDYDT